MFVKGLNYNLPDKDGFFGEFGGAWVPQPAPWEPLELLSRESHEFDLRLPGGRMRGKDS